MSNVANILRKQAEDLRVTPETVAVQMLKEAGMSEDDARYEVAQAIMEKEAASALTSKGVDYDEAVKLVKAANINVRELKNVKVDVEENTMAETLEKAASYVEKLETHADALEQENDALRADLEKMAEELSRAQLNGNAPAMPSTITKLASVGAFTRADLEELEKMDARVLDKVASAFEEPWGFGTPSGMAHQESDPLMDFILSPMPGRQ
jgi:hypothetical protein